MKQERYWDNTMPMWSKALLAIILIACAVKLILIMVEMIKENWE
jgi:hypothetical protein